MTHPEIKKQIVSDIAEAVSQGAALYKCCDVIGIHPRTYHRWCRVTADRRKGSKRTNKRSLSDAEKDQIVEACCSKRFQDKNPYEIVAILLEEGIYIASPWTYYRVLKERGLLVHRGNSRAPRKPYTPPELKATGPDQVYAWDITWIPSMVNGLFWYVYSVEDIWTREIVGWTIYNEESADHAIALFNSIKTRRNLKGTWIHSDNGNPMRGATLAVMLANLGMFLSHSRPLVKNDNAYIESFFKTLKYHAAYPCRFNSMEDARRWVADFIDWYNTEHRHSGIGYVTPQQRRQCKVEALFRKRNATLLDAFQRTPERFPKAGPKLWREKKTVYLNPSEDTRKLLCKKAA